LNPTVTQDLSILSLVTNASVLVQLVMAALLLASLFSWYYIFVKRFQLKRAQDQTDDFEKQFWTGGELATLYQRASGSRNAGSL
jgi:biopolymer transport protein TolQ